MASLVLLGSGVSSQAGQLSSAALETVRHLPIQDRGRLKPFDSFARETVKRLTGSPTWQGQDPVETVLSIVASPEAWQDQALIAVPFVPLREKLGLGRETTHISYDEVVATRKLMRLLPAIVEKEQRSEQLSMLDNETMDVYRRFVTLNQLLEQELHLVPPSTAGNAPWLPHAHPGFVGNRARCRTTEKWRPSPATKKSPSRPPRRSRRGRP